MSDDAKKRRWRSTDERIADLQSEIEKQKRKLIERKQREAKKRELPPSIKRIPSLAKKLQEFAALATEDERMDVANSVSMFLAGLQRVYDEEVAKRAEPEPVAELGEDEADATGASDAGTLEPRPRRAPRGDDAERRFDERLRKVARRTNDANGAPSTGLSEWER